MHIYRDISELGHITVSELQVSTYTTYDIREKHSKNRWNNGLIKLNLIQESIALCFILIMVKNRNNFDDF